MFTIHTFASGSEGNCLLLTAGDVHLLVDAGISTRRICASLKQSGLSLDDIDAILLTHEHSDHVSGLSTLVKHHDTPLYASPGTARQLCYRIAGIERHLRCIAPGERLEIGEVTVTPFATSHDAHGSQDYRIDYHGAAAGILTDTGYVTDEAADALQGVGLLILESNHDIEWLRSGPYPYSLKQRILGDEGHLSNDAAAAFSVEMARQGTEEIVLAHLSRENNTPARALETVRMALDCAGFEEVRLTAAPRGEVSPCYHVEVAVCRR